MSPIFLLSVAGATVLGSYCLYHFLKKYYPHSLQHLNTLGAIVYKIPSLVCWAGISLYYYLGNTNSQPNRSKNSKPKLDTQEEEFQAREEEFQAQVKQRKLANKKFQAMMERHRIQEEAWRAMDETEFAEIVQLLENTRRLREQSTAQLAELAASEIELHAEIQQSLNYPSSTQRRLHTERVVAGREEQTIEASAPPTP